MMTLPHLVNCPHSVDVWCLECVKTFYDALLNPDPVTVEWLQGTAWMAWDTNDPAWLVRGNVKCRNSYANPDKWVFWILGTKSEPTGGWAKPNPRTCGEVLRLLESVNGGNDRADEH